MDKQITRSKQPLNIPTGTILNIGLLVGAFLVGRKLLQTFGVVKTQKEQDQEANVTQAETGSVTQVSAVNPSNPALALNPRYHFTIVNDYIKKKGISKPSGEDLKKIYSPFPGSNIFYDVALQGIAKQIYDSKGFFNDNEEQLFDAFQKTRNQAQISYVSGVFQRDYKRDLFSFLQKFLSEAELSKVYQIIKGKPLI
jgi:hypothetical protein